ncbi:hypothetical protein QFC21_005100 [Naganishia friedmannii]|uniref:Uncharacterized protein n=1 Tax=Naganishia friedmannii TaxID=89922 RepID=A0ACC2VCD4_9TREE|nr:hypothetical protein QFC21_005100 [Naganishia friedmannii]
MSSLPADSSPSAKAGWELMANINTSSFEVFQTEEGANVLHADFDLCKEDYLRQLLVDAEEAHRFLHKLGSKTEEMAGLVSILAASLRVGDSLDSIIAAYDDIREDVEDYDLERETRQALWMGIFRPITASAATQRKAMRAEAELVQGGLSALSMLSQKSSYFLLNAEILIQDKEASLAMQPRNAAVASAWHRLSKARTLA